MKTILFGIAAIVAGAAIVIGAIDAAGPALAGTSPTPTPDPTTDPCDTFKPPLPATCIPTQPPRSEGQDTPTPSATAVVTDVPETPEATNTSGPAPTSTPSGGAGAGGVAPPDTGSGPGSGSSVSWFAVLGVALAASGIGIVSVGARRAR